MMRLYKIFIFIPVLTSILFKVPKEKPATPYYVDGLGELYYEPLGKKGTISRFRIDVDDGYYEDNVINFEIVIINARFSEGKTLFSVSYPTKENTYYLSYDNEYTEQENMLYFYVNNPGKKTYRIGGPSNIPTSNDLEITSDFTYKSKGTVKHNYHGGLENEYATYTFQNFENFYMYDAFHFLDISKLKIFSSEKYFAYPPVGEINLEINMRKKENLKYSFPLTLLKEDNFYLLKLKDVYYVNPLSLEMKTVKGDGFIETSRIYLPIFNIEDLTELECMIIFKDFGLDKDNLFYKFNIDASYSLFGNCITSEFCIKETSI